VAGTIYFFLFDPLGNPVGMLNTNETFRLNGQNKLLHPEAALLAMSTVRIVSHHASDALIDIAGTRILPEGLQN
jgi:hypothetical protein